MSTAKLITALMAAGVTEIKERHRVDPLRPPCTILDIIGGEDEEVANVLFDHLPAYMTTDGNTEVLLKRKINGRTQKFTIKFNRPDTEDEYAGKHKG